PYALAVIVVSRIGTRRALIRSAALLVAPALLVILPWMLKDALVFGNPIAPFANQIFSNPFFYVSTEQEFARNMASLAGLHAWQWPYEFTVRGARTQGFVGPIFLLAPLGLLALRWPAGRRLLGASVFFSAIGFANIGARFLFPALLFLSLALALVLARNRYVA